MIRQTARRAAYSQGADAPFRHCETCAGWLTSHAMWRTSAEAGVGILWCR